MADSPEVKVRLTAEDTGVAAAIRQLGQELKNLKNTQDETASSSLNLKSAFQSLLGAIAVDRVLAFGKSVLDNAVNIGNMSQKTGIATETISVFHKVAEDAGIATDKVDQSLVRAAKSVTLFQGGNVQAAQAMKLLNLRQADFIGLSPDQKILKVVTALGGMQEGFKKTTAAQLLFSRGGSDMIVIANKIAEDGFPRLEAECKRLGILVGQDLALSAQVAKESLQDLEDVGKGVAMQFEAGLLPALADASQVLGKSMQAGGDGFDQLGREAGTALKGIALGFIAIGETVGDALAEMEVDFTHIWDDLKNDAATTAQAIALTFKGQLSGAMDAIRAGEKRHAALEADDLAQKKAIDQQYFAGLKSAYADLFPDSGPIAEKDKATRDAIAKFEAQRDSINLQLNQKKITQLQAERQIKELMAQQIPLLSKLAQEELDLANQRGHASEIARARASVHLVGALKGPEGDVPDLTGRSEKVPPILTAAAAAQLALTLKHEQDQLTVWKAGAAQREEVDKEEYEKGTLNLKAYFDRRRAELQEETAKEIAVLKQERDQVLHAAEAAGVQARTIQQQAHAKSAGISANVLAGTAAPASAQQEQQLSQLRQLQSEADRLTAESLNGYARAGELEAEISARQIESQTKVTQLDAEQFTAEADNKQKILEFLKQIDELQGKTAQGAKEEAAARADEFEKALRQASPEDLKKMDIDPSKVNELVAAFRKLTEAAGDFAEKEKSTQDAIKAFENQRADIEVRLKGGQISELQAHREITALLQKQIPLLTQKAQLELRAAIESGDEERKAQALQALQTIQNLNLKTQQMGTIGKQVSGSLTNDFQSLFMQLASGTKSASQAFTQFGLSVLKSLEEIAAQMLANIVVTKLMNTLGFGGNSQQVAKTIATNDMMITSNAGAAGAAAFASAMEALPFPANLAAAPAAMAAAIAETMSNIAFGSAAKGALLPSDMLIQAHAKEMILPADISTSLRSALDTGSIARPSDLRTPSFNAPEIAAGAGHTDNRSYTGNVTVNQTNSKMSVEEISAAVRRGVRRGF